MKIVFIWNSLKVLGGVEVFLLNLAKELILRGNKVYLLVFEDGELRNEFEREGVCIKIFKRRAKFDPFTIIKIYNWVKKNDIDVLHGNEQFQSVISAFIKILHSKIKVVNTLHIAANEHQSIRYFGFIPKFIFKYSSYITFVSNGVYDSYLKKCGIEYNSFGAKFKVIHNGIPIENILKSSNLSIEQCYDFRRELGIADGDIFGLNIGRLAEQKGQIYLLKSMKSVVKKFPNFKLLIFGTGPLKADLLRYIEENSLSKNVRIFPPRRDIVKIIGLCDIFIFPSLWEGFSLVLLEAMTLGKPIIVTNATGVDEIATDNFNSLIVQKKSPEEIFDRVSLLLENPSFKVSLGNKAYETVKSRFTLEKMTDQYLKLYSC